MNPIPLFGIGVYGKSATVTAQRRLNCYYDIRTDGDGETEIAVFGTPGLTQFLSLPSPPAGGKIRGIYVGGETSSQPHQIFIVVGNDLYVYSMSGVLAQHLVNVFANGSGNMSISDNGPQIIFVAPGSGYIYQNSAVTQISSGYQASAATVSFIQGFFIVNLLGSNQFNISALKDGTTWDSTQFGLVSETPDVIQAVDTVMGRVVLFNQKSIEFWENTGAASFPFQVDLGTVQRVGLAAVWSRAHLNGGIYFLGQFAEGQVGVFFLNGFIPQKVSTTDVDNVINSLSSINDAEALSYVIDGHPMYQLTFPSASRSFLFDGLTQMWSEVQTGTALLGRHIGQFSAFAGINRNDPKFVGKMLVTDYSSPTIYSVDPANMTDNGAIIKRQVVTRHIMKGSNVLGIDELLMDMETGVGIASGQGSSPQIMMDVSKDGGKTYGNQRLFGLGAQGNYQTRVVARRIGNARDTVIRFTMTDPVKFVIRNGKATLRFRPQ